MKLAKLENQTLTSKRVYIPKPGSNKKRPLGVPTLPWRLYLGLLNLFLVYRLQDKVNKSQHGFVPGRGCLTAWRETLGEAVTSDNLFEIDFVAAFDSLKISKISETLHKHGVSKKIITRIIMCAISPTIFPEEVIDSDKKSSD